ncbi:hypothetical protein MACK_000063 [Theileria orientalis]|uniref:Uncharacterized protein n=1 Tax=Theileria orientalis TaxID=68886 RepID=A0A976M976_THEOR|nr:hypothetical protein MACK_000063 [Theileria orientalis]
MNIYNVLLYVFTYFFLLYRKNLVESSGSDRFPRLKPPDLKLLTSDGVQESELQETEYQHKQLGTVGNIHEFELKDEANCSKVKQNNTDVWIKSETDTLINFSSQPSDTDSGQQNSADSTLIKTSSTEDVGAGGSVQPGHKYPIKIVYNTRAKVIWIIFEDGYLGYMYIDGKWTFKIRKNIPSDQHERIASANSETAKSLSTTDSSSLKPETKQSEIPINNLYPTDYSDGNADYPYPESDESTPVDSTLHLLGLGSGSIRVPTLFGQTSSLSRDRKKPSLRGLTDSEERPNIKIFTTSDSDPNTIVELSADKYSVQYYENIKTDYFIELNNDSKCILVKCEGKEVWKEGDHNLNEPTSMNYYKSYKHMVVRDYDKGVIYNEKDEKWNHYATVYYRKGGKKKAASVTRPTSVTVTQQYDDTKNEDGYRTQEDSKTTSVTLTAVLESTDSGTDITQALSSSEATSFTSVPEITEHESSDIKFYVADPSNASNNVLMDNSGFNLTESGNVASYQFNKECTKFIFDDVLMWQHDPNQRGGKLPKSLDYDKSKEIMIKVVGHLLSQVL